MKQRKFWEKNINQKVAISNDGKTFFTPSKEVPLSGSLAFAVFGRCSSDKQNMVLKIITEDIGEQWQQMQSIFPQLIEKSQNSKLYKELQVPIAFFHAFPNRNIDNVGYLAYRAPGFRLDSLLEGQGEDIPFNPPLAVRCYLAAQLILQVYLLEKHGFVHGDLSADNVIINYDENQPENSSAILIDFDNVLIKYPGKKCNSTVYAWGTPDYIHPFLSTMDIASINCSINDHYALGKIIVEIMTLNHNREQVYTWVEGESLLNQTKSMNLAELPCPEYWLTIVLQQAGISLPKQGVAKMKYRYFTQAITFPKKHRIIEFNSETPILLIDEEDKKIDGELSWIKAKYQNGMVNVYLDKKGEEFLVQSKNSQDRKRLDNSKINTGDKIEFITNIKGLRWCFEFIEIPLPKTIKIPEQEEQAIDMLNNYLSKMKQKIYGNHTTKRQNKMTLNSAQRPPIQTNRTHGTTQSKHKQQNDKWIAIAAWIIIFLIISLSMFFRE